MKKHRTRVPDFSHKRPTRPEVDAGKPQPHTPAPAQRPAPQVKPHSTSAKSGRRGQ